MEATIAITIVSIVLLIAGVYIWRIVSREFGRIAGEKGYPALPYARYTFWLGLVGMLMVIALPDRKGVPVPMTSAPDAPTQEQTSSAVPSAPARSVVTAASELGSQASQAAQAIVDFARTRIPSPAEQQADAGSRPLSARRSPFLLQKQDRTAAQGTWKCTCGEVNPLAERKCEVCRAWHCTCSATNPPSKGLCENCGATKPR